MNKQKLIKFISKYYLNGTVNSVILTGELNKLKTRFISGDKTLLGELEMNSWNFGDCEIGVYNTEQLLKLLLVLDEDILVSINTAGDKSIALKVSDKTSFINYMLSDISVISKPPALKSIPEFELEVDITPQVINKFIAGKNALPETDDFTVITDEMNTTLVIGYASINTNRVTIPVTTTKFKDIKNVSFNANIFKEVLVANKDCESATLKVSSEGLSKITFKIDDFDATYWLVATTDVD